MRHLLFLVLLTAVALIGADPGLALTQEPKERFTRKEEGPVWCLAISPDSKFLVTSTNTSLKLRDLGTGKELGTFPIVRSTTRYALAFTSDGKTLAAGGNDEIELHDVASRKATANLRGHSHQIASLAFSPDDKILASASETDGPPERNNIGQLKLWEMRKNKVLDTFAPDVPAFTAVAFSPDGQRIACGTRGSPTHGCYIKFWNAATRQETIMMKGHKSGITSLAYSPDGKWLASASSDKTINIWDLSTYKVSAVLPGTKHGGYVAYTPDSKTLVFGERIGKTIRLYDVATSQEIATLKHSSLLMSMSLSKDGKVLAAGYQDGTVKVWDVPPQQQKDK